MRNPRDFSIGELELFILLNGPDFLKSDPILTDNERQIVLNAIGTLIKVIPRIQNAVQNYKVQKVAAAMATPQPERKSRRKRNDYLGVTKQDLHRLEQEYAVCEVVESFI